MEMKTWVQLVSFLKSPNLCLFNLLFPSSLKWQLHVWFFMTFSMNIRKWVKIWGGGGGGYQKLSNKICAHDSKGTHEQNKANGFKFTLVLPIVNFYIIFKFSILLSVHMTQPKEPLLTTKIDWSMSNPCGVDEITTKLKKVALSKASN